MHIPPPHTMALRAEVGLAPAPASTTWVERSNALRPNPSCGGTAVVRANLLVELGPSAPADREGRRPWRTHSSNEHAWHGLGMGWQEWRPVGSARSLWRLHERLQGLHMVLTRRRGARSRVGQAAAGDDRRRALDRDEVRSPMLCPEGWLEGFAVCHAVPRHALPLGRRSLPRCGRWTGYRWRWRRRWLRRSTRRARCSGARSLLCPRGGA